MDWRRWHFAYKLSPPLCVLSGCSSLVQTSVLACRPVLLLSFLHICEHTHTYMCVSVSFWKMFQFEISANLLIGLILASVLTTVFPELKGASSFLYDSAPFLQASSTIGWGSSFHKWRPHRGKREDPCTVCVKTVPECLSALMLSCSMRAQPRLQLDFTNELSTN